MRQDPRHLITQEAARRERRAWVYVSFTAVMVVVATFSFIWLTW